MAYRTMQGKEIDMDKLMRQNELMPAVSNVRVNARGDELGPGGVIIRKREDIMNAYYEDNPDATPIKAAPVKTQADTTPSVDSSNAEENKVAVAQNKTKKTQSEEN